MLAFIFKLLVSIALVTWIVRGLDLQALGSLLARTDVALAGLAALHVIALGVVQAVRWQWVLRALGGTLGLLPSIRNVFIGQFFNQTLPSTIGGDAMRIWLLHQAGMALRLATHSVVIDRLIALAALVLLGLAGLPWVAGYQGGAHAALAIGVTSAAGLGVLVSVLLVDHLPARWQGWRPLGALATLCSDARRVVGNGASGMPTLLASLFIHVNLSMAVHTLATAMGLDIALSACLVLFPPVMVASAVPISVAGWGVREGAMVAAFALVGVGSESAFALSVLFGLCVVASGLPGGVLWLLGRSRTQTPDGTSTTAP